MRSYGGTVIKQVSAESDRTVFSDNQYFYALYVLSPKRVIEVDFLADSFITHIAQTLAGLPIEPDVFAGVIFAWALAGGEEDARGGAQGEGTSGRRLSTTMPGAGW